MDQFYIEYLNKDKNFAIDRIYFNNYQDAVKWAIKNLSNFCTDIIKLEIN
jgi:tagatose-1,6-bisphosphate aldolase